MLRSTVVLLGPQRLQPTLDKTVDSLGIRGSLAAITAGWEEREGEDQELRAHLGGRTLNLALYERNEDVYRRDPELLRAVRGRHDTLRKMQELYRTRLAHMLQAAREMLHRQTMQGWEGLIEPEVRGAIDNVRALDQEHLNRTGELHAQFEARWRPLERPAVAQHRAEIARILDGCDALCIAGGHVAILLNRMRLFGVLELLREQPVIAWSAGAMVLAQRVVVFHDRPAQGAGDPELLEAGFGACAGLVPLPHAEKRLKLDDKMRVKLFALRFEPAMCVALDPKTRIDWRDGRWSGAAGTRCMNSAGELAEVGAR